MSLIEVLLALLILSITVSSLLLCMAQGMSGVRIARNQEVARGLMGRIDQEYPIAYVDMNEMSDEGTFEDDEGIITYTWYRDITMVDPELRPGLFLVEKRIQWSERGKEPYVEVIEFRYAPDAEVLTSEF